MRRVMLLLCFAQAACFVPVRETYRIKGPSSQLLVTARENAQKLGYETVDGADGGFTLTEYPNRARGSTLAVSASDGELQIAGNGYDHAVQTPGPEAISFRLNESAEILARTTDARLNGVTGPGVESRSRLLTATLDLLLPSAGEWYAVRGDPYLDSRSGSYLFWLTFSARVGLDVVGVGLATELAVLDHAHQQPFSAWVLLTPVVMMVFNRAFALMMDLPAVGHRNEYAASGLPGPNGPPPPLAYSLGP